MISSRDDGYLVNVVHKIWGQQIWSVKFVLLSHLSKKFTGVGSRQKCCHWRTLAAAAAAADSSD
jgi:hypothetical protein